MSEPGSRTLDVRVGSSTDALTPVSMAKRSLAARAPQWLGLSAVVLAAVAADQITKLIVSSQLALDESLLRTTLVSAEKSAHELKAHAKREADLVLEEAHAEARSVTMAAKAERERLVAEARKVRALLEAALDAVEDAADAEAA